MLNSCYENTYFKARLNKFIYFIYGSCYDPKDLRFHYLVSCLTTAASTLLLGAVHPLLPILLFYDYFLLIGFTKVLNQTMFAAVLDKSKRYVYLNRLNFMGYMTKFKQERINLRDIRYMGVYKNNFITLDHRGLLPSISKLIEYSGVNTKQRAADGSLIPNPEQPKNKND